jgi:hypothetical protein
MGRILKVVGISGLGAGVMYFLDPDKGRRRRALVRDRMVSLMDDVEEALGKTSSDVANRAGGLVAEMRSLMDRKPVPDRVLIARVRSEIGRVVSHPRAIQVDANQGAVILSGPILADEVGDLISAVSRVRGVKDVENRLEVHEQAGNIPGLQGEPARPERRFELLQNNWSPTARLLVGLTGIGLAGYGVKRGGIVGLSTGLLGGGLLLRAASNRNVQEMIDAGAGVMPTDIRHTIEKVKEPVERTLRDLTAREAATENVPAEDLSTGDISPGDTWAQGSQPA